MLTTWQVGVSVSGDQKRSMPERLTPQVVWLLCTSGFIVGVIRVWQAAVSHAGDLTYVRPMSLRLQNGLNNTAVQRSRTTDRVALRDHSVQHDTAVSGIPHHQNQHVLPGHVVGVRSPSPH